jgi:hypothetical protein
MSLTNKQELAIGELSKHRDQIVSNLYDIEQILKHLFPEEFDVAYQHWIPQIMTALFDNQKWLPRGSYSMEYTINRLNDRKDDKTGQGVTKYL